MLIVRDVLLYLADTPVGGGPTLIGGSIGARDPSPLALAQLPKAHPELVSLLPFLVSERRARGPISRERLCSEPVFPAILPIQLRLLTGLFQARSPSTLPPPGFLLACTLSRSRPQYSATKNGIIRYRKWYRAQS